jgi:hypothetical protein
MAAIWNAFGANLGPYHTLVVFRRFLVAICVALPFNLSLEDSYAHLSSHGLVVAYFPVGYWNAYDGLRNGAAFAIDGANRGSPEGHDQPNGKTCPYNGYRWHSYLKVHQ